MTSAQPRPVTVETREWRYEDKASWPSGPWQDEPDKLQWQDEATGLACLVVRGPMGALCGYVGVPESHPWFGKDYSDCLLADAKPHGEDPADPHYSAEPNSHYQRHVATKLVCSERWCSHSAENHCDVHGGLTYSGACSPHEDHPERGICHVVEGDDKAWWFGFDCAHLHDVSPKPSPLGDDHLFRDPGSIYRSLGYVKRECERLAAQIAEHGGGS